MIELLGRQSLHGVVRWDAGVACASLELDWAWRPSERGFPCRGDFRTEGHDACDVEGRVRFGRSPAGPSLCYDLELRRRGKMVWVLGGAITIEAQNPVFTGTRWLGELTAVDGTTQAEVELRWDLRHHLGAFLASARLRWRGRAGSGTISPWMPAPR